MHCSTQITTPSELTQNSGCVHLDSYACWRYHACMLGTLLIANDLLIYHSMTEIYRCWIVYIRSWSVIVIPGVILAADAVCGCLSIWRQTIHALGHTVTNEEVKAYLKPFYVLTIVQNIITTGSSVTLW